MCYCSLTLNYIEADNTSSNSQNDYCYCLNRNPSHCQRAIIVDFKRTYKAATTLLNGSQKRACLPVYIHRSEGENNIAFQASDKSSLDEAFKYLEELIDGTPWILTECEKFFSMKPKDTSVDSIRSYFFQLHEQSKRAEMSSDVLLKLFLTNISGGKKMFKEKKDLIKTGMTKEQVVNFFKVVLEKLQKRQNDKNVPNRNKTKAFHIPSTGGSSPQLGQRLTTRSWKSQKSYWIKWINNSRRGRR